MIHEEMAAPEDCVDMTASYTTIVEAADQPSVDSALDLDHLPNPHHEAMATRKQTLPASAVCSRTTLVSPCKSVLN